MNSAPVFHHPLSGVSFDMLTRGAARLRGALEAVRDQGPGASSRALTWADLDRATASFAVRARDWGLRPREAVIIMGANRASVAVAALGALTAGLEPILAPAHASAAALGALARSSGARALFAPMRYGAEDWAARIRASGATLVGALEGEADSAVDFSADILLTMQARLTQSAQAVAALRIGFASQSAGSGLVIDWRSQTELSAQAIGLVSQLGLSTETPVLATLSPASPAGFVAGVGAALLSGAPLHMFGPFDGAAFREALTGVGPCYLTAPAAALHDFNEAGLLSDGRVIGVAASGHEVPPQVEPQVVRLAM